MHQISDSPQPENLRDSSVQKIWVDSRNLFLEIFQRDAPFPGQDRRPAEIFRLGRRRRNNGLVPQEAGAGRKQRGLQKAGEKGSRSIILLLSGAA